MHHPTPLLGQRLLSPSKWLGGADEDGGRTDAGMLSSWMNERTANPQGAVHAPLDHNHDIVFFLEVVLMAFDDLASCEDLNASASSIRS